MKEAQMAYGEKELTACAEAMTRLSEYFADKNYPQRLRYLPPDIRSLDGFKGLDLDIVGDAIIYRPDGIGGLLMLSHPFHHHFFTPGFSNEGLVGEINFKIEMAREYAKNGKWEELIFLYERPFRTQALMTLLSESSNSIRGSDAWGRFFMELESVVTDECVPVVCFNEAMEKVYAQAHGRVGPKQFYELARSVWMDCENIPQVLDLWALLFSISFYDALESEVSPSPLGRMWMSEQDFKEFAELPQTMTIYRGECNDGGISWTRSKKTAEFFARRPFNESTGKVSKRRVHKSQVFAYFTGRNEQEVILVEPILITDL